ncbi:uncharacterized protein [Rutidosis leptorrhynchoides]|uniref:uncharacterized protein n=1 Tax=Rutidosis leptorrhynchoides TaxID=125765 RepID=UPI003A9A32BB
MMLRSVIRDPKFALNVALSGQGLSARRLSGLMHDGSSLYSGERLTDSFTKLLFLVFLMLISCDHCALMRVYDRIHHYKILLLLTNQRQNQLSKTKERGKIAYHRCFT